MKNFKGLVKYLNANQLVLATAESCTGGEIMATLSKQGNCGDCLFIGYVVYHQQAKVKELGVKKSTIEKYTLTSEEVVKEMATGVFQHPEINVVIATTGVIGKSMDGITPGTVCFAWGFKHNKTIYIFTETQLFKGPCNKMPKRASYYALSKLQKYHQMMLNSLIGSY